MSLVLMVLIGGNVLFHALPQKHNTAYRLSICVEYLAAYIGDLSFHASGMRATLPAVLSPYQVSANNMPRRGINSKGGGFGGGNPVFSL